MTFRDVHSRRGLTLPESYTPSGAPAGGSSAPEALPPAAIAPRDSRLAALRDLAREGADDAALAEVIESAIASGDVAALAYELGRADAEGRADITAKLAEAGLRRVGITGPADALDAENE